MGARPTLLGILCRNFFACRLKDLEILAVLVPQTRYELAIGSDSNVTRFSGEVLMLPESKEEAINDQPVWPVGADDFNTTSRRFASIRLPRARSTSAATRRRKEVAWTRDGGR
jgi:hypothetical protein